MADRVALPLATKKVYEVQWAQRTRKGPKTGVSEPEIPMGRSAVWCGNGCQRFLIGVSAGQADFGRKTKRAGLERGAFLAFLPTLFLKFGPTWAILGIQRGKFAPKMTKFPPKGGRNRPNRSKFQNCPNLEVDSSF